jgi:hypothetical protein
MVDVCYLLISPLQVSKLPVLWNKEFQIAR